MKFILERIFVENLWFYQFHQIWGVGGYPKNIAVGHPMHPKSKSASSQFEAEWEAVPWEWGHSVPMDMDGSSMFKLAIQHFLFVFQVVTKRKLWADDSLKSDWVIGDWWVSFPEFLLYFCCLVMLAPIVKICWSCQSCPSLLRWWWELRFRRIIGDEKEDDDDDHYDDHYDDDDDDDDDYDDDDDDDDDDCDDDDDVVSAPSEYMVLSWFVTLPTPQGHGVQCTVGLLVFLPPQKIWKPQPWVWKVSFLWQWSLLLSPDVLL